MKNSNRKSINLRFTQEELQLVYAVVTKLNGPLKNPDDLKRVVKAMVMNITRSAAKEISEQQKQQAKIRAEKLNADRESGEPTDETQLSQTADTSSLENSSNIVDDTIGVSTAP